jgi:tRNA(Phe) wybutosine-synthesizing methylase Tyw3
LYRKSGFRKCYKGNRRKEWNEVLREIKSTCARIVVYRYDSTFFGIMVRDLTNSDAGLLDP